MKKVSATEYDKIMGKKIEEIKGLPIYEQFIELIEESAKYEIKEITNIFWSKYVK